MDRPIDRSSIRLRTARRVVVVGGTIALLSVSLGEIRSFLSLSVRRTAIRTAVVDEGPVEGVISGSGIVMPAVEKVFASPADARVVRILKQPGDTVKKGDAIVELDLSLQRLEQQRLDQNLALKLNQRNQRRLELEERLTAIQNQIQIKTLQLQSLAEELARSQKLYKEGLLSDESFEKAGLAHAQAQLELRQLDVERSAAERSTRLRVEGLDLETAMLRKELSQATRELELATAQADRDGVVTWTTQEEGAAVRKGDVIARVSDLSSYRVEASVSDVHIAEMARGRSVYVRVGDMTLAGSIASVTPTVQNGVIALSIALEQKSSPLLRPRLRVDVFVVTAHKEHVLRLRRGPFLNGAGPQSVFVLRGNKLIRTPIEIGIIGFEQCEVEHGLRSGDEVVVSDMQPYMYAKELWLH